MALDSYASLDCHEIIVSPLEKQKQKKQDHS